MSAREFFRLRTEFLVGVSCYCSYRLVENVLYLIENARVDRLLGRSGGSALLASFWRE